MKNTIIRKICALSLSAAMFSLAVPSYAQQTTVEQAEVDVKVDPARLETAKITVDSLWPVGTYRRIMDNTMTEMVDAMFASMFDMNAADFRTDESEANEDGTQGEGQLSLGEEMEAKDPHARERFEITMRVMLAEITPILERMEPAIRENMAIVLARRFDMQELADMNAFFATPSGQAYARESMILLVDPEIMKASEEFVPEFLTAMPAIVEKVEEATSHLPPPPKPDYGIEEPAQSNETDDDIAQTVTDTDSESAADWENPENWSEADRKRANDLEAIVDKALTDWTNAIETATKNARENGESGK